MSILNQKNVAVRLSGTSLGTLSTQAVPANFLGYKQKKALHIPGVGILLVYNSLLYGLHAVLLDETLATVKPLAETSVNIRNAVGYADIHFLISIDANHETGESRWLAITHEGIALAVNVRVQNYFGQAEIQVECGTPQKLFSSRHPVRTIAHALANGRLWLVSEGIHTDQRSTRMDCFDFDPETLQLTLAGERLFKGHNVFSKAFFLRHQETVTFVDALGAWHPLAVRTLSGKVHIALQMPLTGKLEPKCVLPLAGTNLAMTTLGPYTPYQDQGIDSEDVPAAYGNTTHAGLLNLDTLQFQGPFYSFGMTTAGHGRSAHLPQNVAYTFWHGTPVIVVAGERGLNLFLVMHGTLHFQGSVPYTYQPKNGFVSIDLGLAQSNDHIYAFTSEAFELGKHAHIEALQITPEQVEQPRQTALPGWLKRTIASVMPQ